MKALNLNIIGQVQGVGFRPFIYRLAQRFKLQGSVQNCSGEVIVTVQGTAQHIELFQDAILNEHPPLALPTIESTHWSDNEEMSSFIILNSAQSETTQRHIPPDYFSCPGCLEELNNPDEHRFRYPFINCTQCGPRYTIIYDLPYDRPNTSMAKFTLCPICHKEYIDPLDRRFHAQPLACADCGPELSLLFSSNDKTKITGNEACLSASVIALREGKIIAMKGVGGYHLICDATNEQAVIQLRKRKHRPHKPLAVMFSGQIQKALEQIQFYCSPSKNEITALTSPQRPIVLIKTKNNKLAPSINPGLNQLGVMLAYSPLHNLLLNDFGLPIVATSGNMSGEPVITDNQQAMEKLKNIADIFLQHNRPILRPADDSVLRIIQNKQRLLRIGRGIAPLEMELPYQLKHPILAVGAQIKNTIALAWSYGNKSRVVISPHIGELESPRSIAVFHQVIDDLCKLYRIKPQQVICDMHPNYYSSRYAKNYAAEHNIPLTQVQHHKAHSSIISGEFDVYSNYNQNKTAWLVFSWDGTGLGEDKSIWGGEGFYGQAGQWQRICSIKPFHLQGGDKAAREPWRSACALLWETGNIESTQFNKEPLAYQAWKKRINTHACSSIGRLFDAASALLGLGDYSSFEGQGSMLLEALLDNAPYDKESSSQSLPLIHNSPNPPSEESNTEALVIADWAELLPMLLDENKTITQRALCFHQSLAETLVAQAKIIHKLKGEINIGLSGGVFQNKYLTEYIFKQLEKEGFKVFLPEKVPYNDAGLSFGQIIEGIHQ